MQLLPYSRHSNSIILHFLPFPGGVRENDPSPEFGTQGAIQALYQLRHHGQLYLVFRSAHDSDTPSNCSVKANHTYHLAWHRNTRSFNLNYNNWFIDWISFKCPTVHNISHLSKKASNAEIPSESSHVAETSCPHPPLSVLFINLKANSLVASNCIRSFWCISWPFFRPYG